MSWAELARHIVILPNGGWKLTDAARKSLQIPEIEPVFNEHGDAQADPIH